jgi:uncharacterized protein (UPF0335 family)
MRRILRLAIALALWAFPPLALAQKQETPITNREIVERLTRLEEGQKALAQQLREVNASLNKRIDDVNTNLTKRIDDINTGLNKRIDDLRAEMNQRFDNVNNRFADVNNRFNDVMTLLQIIVSTLVALVLAIAGAGFVMWRKILAVDAAVQTKIGLDQVVREQVTRLEQEVGFVKGKLKELSEAGERK